MMKQSIQSMHQMLHVLTYIQAAFLITNLRIIFEIDKDACTLILIYWFLPGQKFFMFRNQYS